MPVGCTPENTRGRAVVVVSEVERASGPAAGPASGAVVAPFAWEDAFMVVKYSQAAASSAASPRLRGPCGHEDPDAVSCQGHLGGRDRRTDLGAGRGVRPRRSVGADPWFGTGRPADSPQLASRLPTEVLERHRQLTP